MKYNEKIAYFQQELYDKTSQLLLKVKSMDCVKPKVPIDEEVFNKMLGHIQFIEEETNYKYKVIYFGENDFQRYFNFNLNELSIRNSIWKTNYELKYPVVMFKPIFRVYKNKKMKKIINFNEYEIYKISNYVKFKFDFACVDS